MSANMKTRHLTLRIYLSHISDGTLSPSSIFYLPPQPQAKLLFEARKVIPSSCWLKSFTGGAGVCFCCSFVLY